MTKVSKTHNFLFYATLTVNILSTGCGDNSSSKDKLEETIASLIALGNCVDQEPVKLSEEQPEYEKEGLAVTLNYSNLSQKSIVFTPSICKVSQNRIKLNGKEFPVSHILYLKNVNPSSQGMELFFSVKSIPGVEKILRYETESKTLSAGSIEQNDGKGRMLGSAGTIPAGNIALLASSSSLLGEISDGTTIGELAVNRGMTGVVVKTLCQSAFTSLTLQMALSDKDYILPFSISTEPENLCEAIDKIRTPQRCKNYKNERSLFKKTMGKICVFGTGSFMRTFICTFAKSASQEQILPLVGMQGCEKGDSATFCLFNNQELICTLLASLT